MPFSLKQVNLYTMQSFISMLWIRRHKRLISVFIYAPNGDFCARLNRQTEAVRMFSTICVPEEKQ